MALTFTLAGFQTELDAVATALASSSWSTAYSALARANLVLSGLPSSAASDTQTYSMRQDLKAALDLIKAAREVAPRDTRRTIRTGVRHTTQTGGDLRFPPEGDLRR